MFYKWRQGTCVFYLPKSFTDSNRILLPNLDKRAESNCISCQSKDLHLTCERFTVAHKSADLAVTKPHGSFASTYSAIWQSRAGRIRTYEYSSQSAVPYLLATALLGYLFIATILFG